MSFHGEGEPGIMEGPADVPYQIADAHLPEAALVFDAATALDTTMDMVDLQPPLVECLVCHVLLPRELLPQIELNSTVAMPETAQTQRGTPAETPAVEATRPREPYMTPPVDIYETPESLVVIADVPGIDPAHLEVRVDQNILTLRGQTQSQMPGDLRYREYTLVSFFRQFELGEQIDQDGIRAELKQGVLTLTLAKAAKAQP